MLYNIEVYTRDYNNASDEEEIILEMTAEEAQTIQNFLNCIAEKTKYGTRLLENCFITEAKVNKTYKLKDFQEEE